MRVGLVAFLQETNTFVSRPTTIERFEEDVLCRRDGVRAAFEGTHHEVAGFFEGLAARGIDAAPIFAARAAPGGVITAGAMARLEAMLLEDLERAGALDGLLVAAHGATVSAPHPDADGRVLALLRERLGPRKPIVATLDPHANLSRSMARSADALIAYRTNPHLDQRERGVEAARLIARTLGGEVRPLQAASFPPVAIGIACQDTSVPPAKEIMERAGAIRERPGVLAASVIFGFPWADVEEMGSSAVVVADGDASLARECAAELGEEIRARRRSLIGSFTAIDDALDRAEALEGTVALLDMGDNVGGGAPGDGTHILHAIRRRGMGNALACLVDPEAAEEARRAGRGRRLRLRVGGRAEPVQGGPLEDDFTVVGLHDGRFSEPEPRHGAFSVMDQGPSAVLRTDDGLVLLVISRRVPPFSLRQVTSAGIDPRGFRIIVVKGVNAPIAAYRDACRHFIRVDTPGVTTADMRRLEYRRRRRPLFPFEESTLEA